MKKQKIEALELDRIGHGLTGKAAQLPSRHHKYRLDSSDQFQCRLMRQYPAI